MSYLGKDAGGDETTDFNAKTTPYRPNFTPDEDPYTRGLDAELGPVQSETTISEPPNEDFEDYIDRIVKEDEEAKALEEAKAVEELEERRRQERRRQARQMRETFLDENPDGRKAEDALRL